MENTFIKTSDIDTAEKLRKLGYKELKTNNNIFCFINETTKSTFSCDIDISKIIYSNKMTF